MDHYNKNYMDNKIKYFSYVSDWGGVYFGDIKDLDYNLDFYSDNILQKKHSGLSI